MPTYRITGPDGAQYEVTAPEGASEQDVLAYVQRETKGGGAYKSTAQGQSAGQNVLGAIGGAMYGPYLGAKQILGKASPADIEQYKQSMAGLWSTRSGKVGTVIGGLAAGAPVFALPGANTLIGAALAGGALGALQPTGEGESRALNAGVGAAGGAAGQVAGRLLGRVLNPVRSQTAPEAAKVLAQNEVPATAATVTRSPVLQWTESVASKLPGGGRLRAVQEAQQQAFNRAALRAAGGSGSAVTPEAVDVAKAATGQAFKDAVKGVTVKVDDPLLTGLANVEARYGNRLDALQKPVVQRLIDELSGMNEMSGEFYQATRSDIGKMAQVSSGAAKDALKGIQKALDAAFDRYATPQAAQKIAQARVQYGTGKIIEKMATSSGNLSPARVANAARNLPPASRGLADVGDLLRKLPDSATAQRLLYQSLLSGGAGAAAGIATGDPWEGVKWGAGTMAAQVAGPWLASQFLTRGPTQAYLTRGLVNVTPRLEDLLLRVGAESGGLFGLGVTRK
jgi:hypothetical protein